MVHNIFLHMKLWYTFKVSFAYRIMTYYSTHVHFTWNNDIFMTSPMLFLLMIFWVQLWRSYDIFTTDTPCLTYDSETWGVFCKLHGGVIKWRHFPRYWPFVLGIPQSPANSCHKGQWRWAFMFSMIYAWISCSVNNCAAGDLRCHHAHYDITVMLKFDLSSTAVPAALCELSGYITRWYKPLLHCVPHHIYG